jgi:hypothetical protein
MRRIKIQLTVISLLMAIVTQAQVFNRVYPPKFPPYEFLQKDTIQHENYFFLTPGWHSKKAKYLPHLAVLDANGFVFWYKRFHSPLSFPMDLKQQQNGMYTYSFRRAPLEPPKNFVMDAHFNLIDSVGGFAPYTNTDEHDFRILPNGNYLILTNHDTILDLSGMNFNGTKGSDTTHVVWRIIQEMDTNKKLVFQWHSKDYISISDFDTRYNYNPTHHSLVHGNGLDVADDGNIIASFRVLNSIYKINRKTGEIMWVFGGKKNQFKFLDDKGISGQHNPGFTDGKLTMFDNGNLKEDSRSRGVMFELNEQTLSATKKWEYYRPDAIYCKRRGSFQFLENDYKLISWGVVFRPKPTFTLLNQKDQIAAELYFLDTVQTYRTFMEPLTEPISRPKITCKNGMLSAPSGYSDYTWSTGKKTSTITVKEQGYHQAYVSYGEGMLGSEVVYISDPKNACATLSVVTGQ